MELGILRNKLEIKFWYTKMNMDKFRLLVILSLLLLTVFLLPHPLFLDYTKHWDQECHIIWNNSPGTCIMACLPSLVALGFH